jgi:putative flavoprotein involved in K+ transport
MGRALVVSEGTLTLAPDLAESLAAGDARRTGWKEMIDTFIAAHGIAAPEEPQVIPPKSVAGLFPGDRLNLRAAGIAAVVWASGFDFDLSWVRAPSVRAGKPLHNRGVTSTPGLYFLRIPPLYSPANHIDRIGEDASYLAGHILNPPRGLSHPAMRAVPVAAR